MIHTQNESIENRSLDDFHQPSPVSLKLISQSWALPLLHSFKASPSFVQIPEVTRDSNKALKQPMMAQLEKSNLFLSTVIWIYKQSSSTKIKNGRFDSIKSAERMQIVPIG